MPIVIKVADHRLQPLSRALIERDREAPRAGSTHTAYSSEQILRTAFTWTNELRDRHRMKLLGVVMNMARGALIGSVEIIPGLSGGTVALVVGV